MLADKSQGDVPAHGVAHQDGALDADVPDTVGGPGPNFPLS